jgi:hypothetical protein
MAGWHNPPDECCVRWTADGKYFLFQSNDRIGSGAVLHHYPQIWALPKSALMDSSPKPILLTSPCFLKSGSQQGRKKALCRRTGAAGELMRYDSQSHQFSPFLVAISAEYVAFSKNGDWVAYVAYPVGTLWRSKLDAAPSCTLRTRLCIPCCFVGLPAITFRRAVALVVVFAALAEFHPV